MAMHEFLAELYGTNKTAAAAAAPAPNQEEIDKQAHVQLFLQSAAQEGIDLKSLSSEKVAEIYAGFTENMAKAAGAQAQGTAAQTTDLEALARAEHAKTAGAQAAYQQKMAEADFSGRVMAHAYVQELHNIAKTAGEMPPAFAAHIHGKGKDGDKDEDEKKKKEKEKEAAAAASKTAGAISISNLDRVAAEYGLGLVAEYNKTAGANGIDMAVAEQKLAAVLVLGAAPTEKTAGIVDFDQVKHIRSLELLSQAGFPVSW